MKTRHRLIATAIVLGCTQNAVAQEREQMFKLSGFGTLGVANSTEDQADVTPDF